MPSKVEDVLKILTEFAPPALACGWDNVGLLVDAGRPVTAIATALDITPAVVQAAAQSGCELIVSHHPVIFDPLKTIKSGDVPALLLKNGISAICMHTNLDAAPGGVNDTLAALMGMQNTESFAENCGRIGAVPATSAAALAVLCREKLGAHVKYVEAVRPINRLAVVSGGGGSYLQEALDLGADCLLTGEGAHHIALLAQKNGAGLVVAGHWATEYPVTAVLAALLAQRLPGVRVAVSAADADPYTYL